MKLVNDNNYLLENGTVGLEERNGRVVHAATRSLARLRPPAAAVPRLTGLTKSEKSWERAWGC